MHIGIAMWVLFASWIYGDWKNWQRYHSTMLYIAIGNQLYHFLAHPSHLLWKLQPDFVVNHPVAELMYTFIIYPFTAFLFLSNYPKRRLDQILHIMKWLFIYISVEWVGQYFEKISYYHGWNLGWSLLFDSIMFPMLRLHYIKPLWAYLISVPVIFMYMFVFDIPIE